MTVEELNNTLTAKQLERLHFISDSQDVQAFNAEFDTEFDSYFVIVGEGEYEHAYGMHGIVPYFQRTVTQVF